MTGHASSRLVLNQHGPPHVVANARVESQEAFFVDVMARGKTEAVMSDSNICPANVLANSVQAGEVLSVS